ncbi:MAG: hypothetical protein NTZ87_00610 [Candidatus Nomurabacteria bacterium]|nr:hypothetical protein [Candidatus Nomurabacteria bacterium]
MEDNKNRKQSKYFLLIICLALLLIVISAYYNFFIKNDYEVTKQVSCDPKTEACFVSDCDANDSSCDQTTTYKKITAPSKYAGSDFDSFTCVVGNPNCKIITCNADTIEAGEKCFE